MRQGKERRRISRNEPPRAAYPLVQHPPFDANFKRPENSPLLSMVNMGVSVVLERMPAFERSALPVGPNSLLETRLMIERASGSFERSVIRVVALGSFEHINAPKRASASFNLCSKALK